MKAKQVALYGVLTSLMLVLGFLERQFVLMPGVPGIKLGLSNTVLLFALCLIDRKSAWLLMGLKVVLGGLLFAGISGMLYSLAGGILSMAAMTLLLRPRGLGLTGVSVAGAAAHMLGQVGMARLLMGSWAAAAQLPLLLVAAVITGILTGIIAGLVCRALSQRDPDAKKRLLSLGISREMKQGGRNS